MNRGGDRGLIRVLLVPADVRLACRIVGLKDSAVAFSDALGGGLLEEIHHGAADGRAYCVYGDGDRVDKGLATNERFGMLAARLGWIDQAPRLALLGDLLIVGAGEHGDDSDVPWPIVEAAERCGLLVGPMPMTSPEIESPIAFVGGPTGSADGLS